MDWLKISFKDYTKDELRTFMKTFKTIESFAITENNIHYNNIIRVINILKNTKIKSFTCYQSHTFQTNFIELLIHNNSIKHFKQIDCFFQPPLINLSISLPSLKLESLTLSGTNYDVFYDNPPNYDIAIYELVRSIQFHPTLKKLVLKI